MDAPRKSGIDALRVAVHADIDELVRIINRAYAAEVFCVIGNRTNVNDIHARFDLGTFLVLDDPVDAARLIAAVYVTTGGKRGYMGLLTVDPDVQGRGLSHVLVSAAEAHCSAAGCEWLDLTVINVRENLFPFYTKFGFGAFDVAVFPEPSKMRMPLHLVKMTKMLCRPGLLTLAE